MPIPDNLKNKMKNFEKSAEEIEKLAIDLITYAPLSYHPSQRDGVIVIGASEYSWASLPSKLRELQSEVIGKYRSWFHSALELIKKYLPNEEREFNKYYQKANNRGKVSGVIDFLQFNVIVWKRDKSDVIKSFQKIFSIQRNLLSSIKYLEIEEKTTREKVAQVNIEEYGNKIFIVHGHDEGMKQSVARVITKLNLEPIILHEHPNKGRTIIEKFKDYSNVGFAIVLLSPDDKCKKIKKTERIYKFRARQNVIFEMGFFIGKLGRERVIMLFKEEENFEMPTDHLGILYISYDKEGNWKFKLVRELNAQGYSLDANVLL